MPCSDHLTASFAKSNGDTRIGILIQFPPEIPQPPLNTPHFRMTTHSFPELLHGYQILNRSTCETEFSFGFEYASTIPLCEVAQGRLLLHSQHISPSEHFLKQRQCVLGNVESLPIYGLGSARARNKSLCGSSLLITVFHTRPSGEFFGRRTRCSASESRPTPTLKARPSLPLVPTAPVRFA